jgi:hypothetical protein
VSRKWERSRGGPVLAHGMLRGVDDHRELGGERGVGTGVEMFCA